MALEPIHAFYCSKDWLDLTLKLKIKSNGVCARCGKIFDMNELRPHHIIELTLDNLNDVNITLNENNIEVICHDCHNATHNRFTSNLPKQVFIIWGCYFSGRHDYLNSVATRNDLIVDIDKIQKAISLSGNFDRPDATKKTAFKIYDLLIDSIKFANAKRTWQNAYIIGGFPLRYDREFLAHELNAKLIYIESTKQENINRCCGLIEQPLIRDAYIGYIEKWWKNFQN